MIILYSSIIAFNLVAFKTVKRFSWNMITHIWLFTCVFQMIFDVFIDLKYKGYWYGTKGIDLMVLPAYFILIPSVNLMFLNWYPFNKSLLKQLTYLVVWEVVLISYEFITLLPEPWGFFHYGWWSLWHSAFVNPILLLILLGYHKWVRILEAKVRMDRDISH